MEILGIAGSLRAESYSKKVLEHLRSEALERGVERFDVFDIGSVPHYSGDLDHDDHRPDAVRALIAAIEAADGLVLVTPEYNYAIPGVLKNALDWASRPAYQSCLAGKPTTMVGCSMGAIGGARAVANLRQVLGGTLTPVLPYPEVLVGGVHHKFEGDSKTLTDERTGAFLAKFVDNYLAWLKARS